MARKTRNRMVGRFEDVERREREKEYRELGWVLRREWQALASNESSSEGDSFECGVASAESREAVDRG